MAGDEVWLLCAWKGFRLMPKQVNTMPSEQYVGFLFWPYLPCGIRGEAAGELQSVELVERAVFMAASVFPGFEMSCFSEQLCAGSCSKPGLGCGVAIGRSCLKGPQFLGSVVTRQSAGQQLAILSNSRSCSCAALFRCNDVWVNSRPEL